MKTESLISELETIDKFTNFKKINLGKCELTKEEILKKENNNLLDLVEPQIKDNLKKITKKYGRENIILENHTYIKDDLKVAKIANLLKKQAIEDRRITNSVLDKLLDTTNDFNLGKAYTALIIGHNRRSFGWNKLIPYRKNKNEEKIIEEINDIVAPELAFGRSIIEDDLENSKRQGLFHSDSYGGRLLKYSSMVGTAVLVGVATISGVVHSFDSVQIEGVENIENYFDAVKGILNYFKPIYNHIAAKIAIPSAIVLASIPTDFKREMINPKKGYETIKKIEKEISKIYFGK